jgi:hypothetical protein
MRKHLPFLLVFACLAVLLAACQPGGGSATGSAPTSTPHTAPINVPQGYQGLVIVSFTADTTYDQAVAVLQSAGMTPRAQCPNGGPILASPTGTPVVVDQQRAMFAESHTLTAVANTKLTQAMLEQVASSAQVTSVDKAPLVECPLAP